MRAISWVNTKVSTFSSPQLISFPGWCRHVHDWAIRYWILFTLCCSRESGCDHKSQQWVECLCHGPLLLWLLQQTRKKLRGLQRLCVVDMEGNDPSKIIISTKNANITGRRLYQRLLEKYHLQMEMAAGCPSTKDTLFFFHPSYFPDCQEYSPCPN